jgi:hypothetical protein
MTYCKLTMQETKFLVALLENAPASRQTALQLLAAEHLYIPTLLPKLKAHAKRLKAEEQLERSWEAEATDDDYMPDNTGDESLREYDA